MRITSASFEGNAKIPEKFTCEGADVNPGLIIEELPENTRSLALIMDDPDSAHGTFLHWLVYDIPPERARIAEDSVPGTQGKNDFGSASYGGPCPSKGEHRYFFKVFALDTTLGLAEGASKRDVEKAMDGHILDHDSLMGTFSRS